jgi:selenocysteine lyase/cysteine desulfurase
MASLDFAIRELVQHDFQSLVKEKAALSEEVKNQLIANEFLPQWVSERSKHSSIFNIKGGEELFAFLHKHNIRCVQRGSGVRVSFHFYNTENDLNKLLKTLKTFRELNSHLAFD